jgi:hypothetical protein
VAKQEESRRRIEWRKCADNIDYWIETYVFIFNANDGEWIRFELWPAQVATLERLERELQLVILKARQLGLSWLTLCYVLHRMIFKPAATALIFSKRDEEAIELLSRLKGIYIRLPKWMRARRVESDSEHDWSLSNGSSAKAFPATGGRSYTGSIALIDEADFVSDLDGLINAVKPTIDAGGQLFMISTVDKSAPESPFKRIFRGAKSRLTQWGYVFLPWSARPGRDATWYAAQEADVLARTGALDDMHQEYPATDTEALAPRSLDKRIPSPWIEACYVEEAGFLPKDAPSIPGLVIYRQPEKGRRYVIGVDPAEGNPTSDDSALTVMDRMTGEEVAALAGKFQPQIIADHAFAIGKYFNNADVLVERNNHGHAVILRLMYQTILRILAGLDDRLGWLSMTLGKTILYDELADAFREKSTTLHSFATYTQIAAIEGSTLRGPSGTHDDRADSYALANVARALSVSADAADGDQMVVHDENLQISPY